MTRTLSLTLVLLVASADVLDSFLLAGSGTVQNHHAFGTRKTALGALSSTTNPTDASSSSKEQPAKSTNTHVLILPGFGNDAIDYTMDQSLVSSLLQRNIWTKDQISVLPVQRTDWLNVFWRGLFDLQFWRNEAPPTRPAFRWYLDLVLQEVERIVEGSKEGEDLKVLLLGHSAGGWLARAVVGFCAEEEETMTGLTTNGKGSVCDKIAGIVTLGTPQSPPPAGVMDMTRGALRITHERFPGAYHAPSIFYVTVIGNAVQGQEQARSSPFESTTVEGFAFESYKAVCGDGNAIGDGVVPVESAHLDQATQLNLDGVYHSINAPTRWYGADSVIDQWLDVVVKEINDLSSQKKTSSASFDR